MPCLAKELDPSKASELSELMVVIASDPLSSKMRLTHLVLANTLQIQNRDVVDTMFLSYGFFHTHLWTAAPVLPHTRSTLNQVASPGLQANLQNALRMVMISHR